MLPFYVARLRAAVVDAPPGVALVYRWSLPSSAQGLLAADLDPGPAGELCLTQSHCSQTFTMPCTNDEDCDPTGQSRPVRSASRTRPARACCSSPPGRRSSFRSGSPSISLHETVRMRNVLPDTAKIKDTWQATVAIPGVSAEKSLSYRIRGRPGSRRTRARLAPSRPTPADGGFLPSLAPP